MLADDLDACLSHPFTQGTVLETHSAGAPTPCADLMFPGPTYPLGRVSRPIGVHKNILTYFKIRRKK